MVHALLLALLVLHVKSGGSVSHNAQHLVRREASPEPHQDTADMGFTILVNTFNRDGCLIKGLQHWLNCNPKQIRVFWNDVSRPVPPHLESLASQSKGVLVVDKMPSTDLTNRFDPTTDFITDALFSVDDDDTYSCDEVRAAYSLWTSHQNQMVGYAPRLINSSGYTFLSYDPNLGWSRANALWVTKGGFLHKKFYRELFSSKFDSIRLLVNQLTTGEDILMSFVVASSPEGGLKPIPLVSKSHADIQCRSGKTALAANPNSQNIRSRIIRKLYLDIGDVLKTVDFEDFYVLRASFKQYIAVGSLCGPRDDGRNSERLQCIETVHELSNFALSQLT